MLQDNRFLIPDVWVKVLKYSQGSSRPKIALDPGAILPAPSLPVLPKFAYQPRLWGRAPDRGNFRAASAMSPLFPGGPEFYFQGYLGGSAA